MSTRVIARAPGKLFLLGEYAVLDGCPAVVAAIDRFVAVSIDGTANGPGVRIQSALGMVEFSCAAPPAESGPLRFAIAAFRTAVHQLPELARHHLSITVVSGLDEPTGMKLGLGSSAAVTVAVTAALFAVAGHPLTTDTRHRIFSSALEAHRRAQGNTGSGTDIAASVYGGALLFRPREGLPEITALTLPPDTQMLVGWTGEPASTPGLVQRYSEVDNGRAAKRTAFVRATQTSVRDFVGALEQGALSVAAVLANGHLLEQLADDLDLELLTPRLRQLVNLARKEGAGAKISGAGGGDCGIAFTQDAATGRRVRAAWEAVGLTPLDVSIYPEGVTSGLY